MNTHVRDWELTLILLASIITIVTVLFIVGKWLNFNVIACCVNWARNRKSSTIISVREQSTQVLGNSFEAEKKQL